MTALIAKAWIDRRADRVQVPAEIWSPVSAAHLDEWESVWSPEAEKLLDALIKQGVDQSELPEHSHWDWKAKSQRVRTQLAFDSYALVAEGQLQGLMQILLTRQCREVSQAGKPQVYVTFVEAAPWNQPLLMRGAMRYRGIGRVLIATAVNRSIDEGFKGRIGLHSLHHAHGFYRDACGMTDMGVDAKYEDLPYLEMTEQQAQDFLQGRRVP